MGTSKRQFKCMKCDEVYEIETYDSVNVSKDMYIKERVLSGDIFHFECPHCHKAYMLSYPCLYHDSDNKFMVWLADEAFFKNLDISAYSYLLKNGYILRRCEDINSFIEKIQILDDRVDDRAVEFAKYDTYIEYTHNRNQKSEDIEGIYYHGIDNDVLKINIKNKDKGLTMMIPYEPLMAQMDEHPDLFSVDEEGFSLIDAKWIIQIFSAAEKDLS